MSAPRIVEGRLRALEQWRETRGQVDAATADSVDTWRSPQGATMGIEIREEEITLDTVGLVSESLANLLPPNALLLGVTARVTVTITGATTTWAVGDPTTAARFSAANATLTAGTTSVGLDHLKGGVASDAAGPTQPSEAKIRITCVGLPTAGKIRVTVFSLPFTAAIE